MAPTCAPSVPAGTEEGQFLFPIGLARDGAGNVLVSEMLNGRVQVLGADLEPQRTLGQPGDRYGDFGKPKHLAVGPDGVIFVADAAYGHLTLFDGEGRLLMLLGDGRGMPFGVAATASEVPVCLAELVPDDFDAHYFLFVSHTTGETPPRSLRHRPESVAQRFRQYSAGLAPVLRQPLIGGWHCPAASRAVGPWTRVIDQ